MEVDSVLSTDKLELVTLQEYLFSWDMCEGDFENSQLEKLTNWD